MAYGEIRFTADKQKPFPNTGLAVTTNGAARRGPGVRKVLLSNKIENLIKMLKVDFEN